jgi:ABC-type multidrug transport system fused ATPase/permease subunit
MGLGALLLEFVLEYVQALVTTYIGQRVMRDLRLEIFEHLQRLSIPYFDRNPVGRLMTRVTSDVETLNELFSSGVVTVFGDLFTLAAIMSLMLAADWRLALVAFAVIPLVYLLARVFRRRVRDAFRDIRLLLARLNSYLQEHLSGMRVVQLFAREPASAREFGGINEEHLQAHLRSVTIYALFFPGDRDPHRHRARARPLVRRPAHPRRHPHHRRARGVHPAHAPLLPAAAGPLREVQPPAGRDGLIGTHLPPPSTSPSASPRRRRPAGFPSRCAAR